MIFAKRFQKILVPTIRRPWDERALSLLLPQRQRQTAIKNNSSTLKITANSKRRGRTCYIVAFLRHALRRYSHSTSTQSLRTCRHIRHYIYPSHQTPAPVRSPARIIHLREIGSRALIPTYAWTSAASASEGRPEILPRTTSL